MWLVINKSSFIVLLLLLLLLLHPLTLQCQQGRTFEEAKTTVLMNGIATQPQSQPLLQKDGYLFHRVVVDLVPAIDGSVYEVLFLLASVNST